ncbi:TonB-dependent receptor [Sphingosinicella terrae]|uniref:TonB-dependent receptor n=1 Tax=Sphingosinicella terrae TaxID=2172047 RepID=UPI000E0CD209|nr:TonB-dependent receptor [Sphingosinicella terrae]
MQGTWARRRRLISASLLTIALLGPQTALAQDGAAEPAASAAEQEDDTTIVVTATRRDESLADVPFSIQAVGGEELARTGAVNFADYARSIAGVSFLDDGPGRSQIFIRGVSTGGDVDTGKESTVGVYIDETPVTEGSSQPDLRLYDIDRVEVLRGPQGTLYGSGSLGGTVRIITNQPRFDEVAGYGQLLGSATEEGGLNGSANGWVNVPISDSVAIRAVGYAIHNSGFIDNGFSGEEDINEEDTYGGRIALRARPGTNLDVILTGAYQETDIEAYNRATDAYPELALNQSAPEPFHDRLGTANLTVNLDLSVGRLTSSSSYFDRRRAFENDIDYFLEAGFGIPRGASILSYEARSFAQEVRLASTSSGPFTWLVGAFYLNRDEEFVQTINVAGVPPAETPGGNLYYASIDTQVEQVAGFAEIGYEILPALTATVGARLSQVERSAARLSDGPALGGRSEVSGNFSESSTTPRFNLSYEPPGGILVYAQAAQGFRIGGVNAGLPPCGPGCTIDVGPTFRSDSLWNYELGAKIQLDRAVLLAGSIFWIDWRDIQLNVSRGDGFNGFLNAGTARSRGFELELNGRLTDQLSIGGQVTYTDATLRSLAPGVAGFATPGTRLPDVPEFSAAANATWTKQLGADSQLYLRGDVQFVGDRISNLGPGALPLDEYVLVNLRIGVDFGRYSTSLFVSNLFDERAQLSRNSFSGVRDGSPIAFDRYTVNVPRTIGVSIARNF